MLLQGFLEESKSKVTWLKGSDMTEKGWGKKEGPVGPPNTELRG